MYGFMSNTILYNNIIIVSDAPSIFWMLHRFIGHKPMHL